MRRRVVLSGNCEANFKGQSQTSKMKSNLKILLLVVCFGITQTLGQNSIFMDMEKVREAIPEIDLTIVELIEKYNYPAETHEVTTDDGYILEFFRIPHAPNSNAPNPKPVLFMHGMLGQPENFATIMNTSLARYLVDRGYDAWLGSTRGGQHSRRHKFLDPDLDQPKFWNYSFHEIALYDVPAMIDYILDKTGKSKLTYIGHSQGGTIFYIMCTMRPEYQEKIAIASLLAPAGSMSHLNDAPNPLSFFSKSYRVLEKMSERLNLYELPPKLLKIEDLIHICASPLFRNVCLGLSSAVLGGGDMNETDPMYLPMFLKFFGTISAKQPLHFAQIITSRRFRPWDYGSATRNRIAYGKDEPDDYPVETIKVPIAFYYSAGDAIISAKDIEDMCDAVQNCIRKYVMPNKKWSHVDFVTSRHVNEVLNKPLFEFADNYGKEHGLFD